MVFSPPKPRKEQLKFLNWEMGAFFHFGIRTFFEGHRDWDGKLMPLSGFNPIDLDCENWIKTVYEAGMKYAILVCKHHDGFANWPSKSSSYHVGLTPWKDGKGDVVAEFTAACRKYGIGIGLYYSPAEAGYKERSAKEYDDYFISQISELLGNYGKIDYIWFDGNGSQGHEYDKNRIIKAIRGLQPEILIFDMWDPDTRWIGNEAGIAGPANKNAVKNDDRYFAGQECFLPGECDFMMRRHNWFYSEYDVHTVKSVDELVGLYYYSVGNGANFLINIGPDRRGLLPDLDAARLLEFGYEISRRFSNPLPAETVNAENGFRLVLAHEQLINHLVLTEDLTEGESIQEFSVFAASHILYGNTPVHMGKTVGHKRIITFPSVLAKEIRVEVTKAEGEFNFGTAKAFYIK